MPHFNPQDHRQHSDRRLLELIHEHQHTILERLQIMSVQFDNLLAATARNTSVVESMKTLIGGLRQQIIDAGTDATKLQAVIDDMTKVDDAAQAVLDNTPASPQG